MPLTVRRDTQALVDWLAEDEEEEEEDGEDGDEEENEA